MIKALLRLLALCALIWPFTGEARPLIADLSRYYIEIDTDFRGTDILLYGATNEPGDVIVIVRGPERRILVRKKERKGGIWMNASDYTFPNIPMFHGMAYSLPAPTPDETLTRLLGLTPAALVTDLPDGGAIEFKNALVDIKTRKELYHPKAWELSFMGETLFRSLLVFPETTPRGQYTVEVYLVNDGQVTAFQILPLTVVKIGLDAFIFDLANRHPALYGILAIFIALAAGWIGGTFFRKT